MRAGDCLVVVAQWQITGCTSQVSWVRVPAAAGLFMFFYVNDLHHTLVSGALSFMTYS